MTQGKFSFTALHHVQLAIPPDSEEVCRKFWGQLLGMQEIEKPQALAARGGCWFRSGTVEVHLGVEERFTPSGKAHPGILVDDLHALADALDHIEDGVHWDNDFPGYLRFYTTDPFGNRLEFLEKESKNN